MCAEFQGAPQEFDLDTSVMRLALETYQNEGKPLCNLEQTLKNEGFYRKHTVCWLESVLCVVITLCCCCRCLCAVMLRTLRESF